MMNPSEAASPPRLVPGIPLPPYTYVPGRFPHPTSDPHGHSFGIAPQRPDPPDAQQWQGCRPYLYGIDLFNHGYYWEAHEVWEGLWHACGRRGPTADFLKGLIHLAAAGVKVREGQLQGVHNHARRAAALFQQTAAASGAGEARYMGLALTELTHAAQAIADQPPSGRGQTDRAVEVVFDLVLRPA